MEMKGVEIRKLDDEWVYLVLQAKKMGLQPDEVRAFLRSASKMQQTTTVPGKLKNKSEIV
ncbi:anti-repressor SinI family protein [Neobacillus niacini]|uniref:anti-repressor SinI family protein n=1 Tax=Neobacillus niacini TaxID=86668 RepID=UPI0021CAFC71|nr:anti-repressor SinI family protein [Neobacillus niacini]MCM3763887.1 anti-repressor SinI family protein [Neobacillus niacini]